MLRLDDLVGGLLAEARRGLRGLRGRSN